MSGHEKQEIIDALVAALERVAPHTYQSGDVCFCHKRLEEYALECWHSSMCQVARAALAKAHGE